jgi:hypothetical protein
MKPFTITYLCNSDYCRIKPSDPECHRTVEIEAESLVQAQYKLWEMFGCKNDDAHNHNALPVVWEIV